jgi:hypothetical protein
MLKLGMRGGEVERWQHFLVGQGLLQLADGDFGPLTEAATKKFQRSQRLHADGVVGNLTLRKALDWGFDATGYEETSDTKRDGSISWPKRPTNIKPLTRGARKQMLGTFSFEPAPTKKNAERIVVDPSWVRQNIIRLDVGEYLGHVWRMGSIKVKTVRFHKVVAPHFLDLLKELRRRRLLDRIFSWDGDYYPRFVRGSTSTLSNHSFGSAFDINRQQNGLGVVPAGVGEHGSVREIVPVANAHGFFWGGHYRHRKDGMHFEFVGTPRTS